MNVNQLIQIFNEQITIAKQDSNYGMPDFVKHSNNQFLENNSFIVFSDPYDYMAAECFNVLRNHDVLGVCADRLPTGCEGRNLLSALDVYNLAKTHKNLVAVMCTDDPSYDLGLRQVAAKSGLRMIPHHLILRLAKATTDIRNSDWYETILNRQSEYLDVVDKLNDDFSKLTTLRVLLSQLTGDHSYRRGIERPYHTLYFNTGLFEIGDEEIFVDCGASQGESINNLLRETGMKIKHSYEVEPDKFNVVKLEKLRQSYKRFGLTDRIEIVPVAVGDTDAIVPFHHTGTHSGSISDGANGTVQLTTIDKITNQEATLIKMDLEGYERQALAGATQTLKQSKPKLAISAYHRPDDLIEITNSVLAAQPDYKVGVQHHTFHRWDTCLYFY